MSARALVPTAPTVPVPERTFKYLSWPHVFALQALGRIPAGSQTGWLVLADLYREHAAACEGIAAAHVQDEGPGERQRRLDEARTEAREELRLARRTILPGQGLVAVQDPARALELALATLHDSRLDPLPGLAVAATVATISPAEPAPAAPGVQELVRNAFEGHEITTVTFQGRPVVLANQVGDALGYSDDGLTTTIARNWSDEMTEGKDYLKVTNGNLRDLKTLFSPPDGKSGGENLTPASPIPDRAAHVIVLTESGFGFVCIKTEKPLGKKLRREWADRIFPSLMRPELAPPPPVPSPDLTTVQGELARLRAQMDELQHQLSSGSRPVRAAPAQGTLPLLPEASDATTSPLEAFVALWLAKDGGAWSSVAQLLPLAQEAGLVGPNHYPGHRAQLCRLGKLLSAQPQLAEHQVVRQDTKKVGGRKYAVVGR
ncbi:MAG: hypothetical protein RBU45_15725 [Myxococcota bacterium]|jgi:prophage antirepressor-like protein|nr:hypothetical protein [Myxococcota bacterium]